METNGTNGAQTGDHVTSGMDALSANEVHSDGRFESLIAGLFANPDVATIQPATDPRFHWVLGQIGRATVESGTLKELLRSLNDSWSRSDNLDELISHLTEYVRELEAATLEDELFGIVTPLLARSADRVPILLARLGWDGQPTRTLAAAGEAAGVTRERIRQMQANLEEKLHASRIWTPVLDRALAVVSRHIPLAAKDLGSLLQRAGLSDLDTFDSEGLVRAQMLFRRPHSLAVEEIEGITFLVDKLSPTSLALRTRLAALRAAMVKMVNHQGIASLHEISSVLPDAQPEIVAHDVRLILDGLEHYRLIDDTWIIPTDIETRNPLTNRLNKLLLLRPGITLAQAVEQLKRDQDRGYAVATEGLRAFCRHRSDVTLVGDRIFPTAALELRATLSEGELALVQAFRRAGPTLSFAQLVDAVQGAGLTKVTASMLARRSVILRKLERDRYALVDGLSKGAAVDLDEHAPERPETMRATTEAKAVAPGAIDIIAFTCTLVRRRGAVTIAEILEELQKRGQDLRQGQLLPFLVDAIDLTILDGRWVAGSRFMSGYPLVERATKLMAVFPGIPVLRAAAQVSRRDEFVPLPRKQAIAQVLASRDEFRIEDGHLLPRQPVVPDQILDPAECFLLTTLRGHPEGMHRGRLCMLAMAAGCSEGQLDQVLATSPIVFQPHAETFTLCLPPVQGQLPEAEARASASTSTAADTDPPARTPGTSVHPNWLRGMMDDVDRLRADDPRTKTAAIADGTSPLGPDSAPDKEAATHRESPAVRAKVNDCYNLLAAATGIVTLNELFRKVNASGVQLTRAHLESAIARISPLAVLRDTWVASLGAAHQSVLCARLRELLSVCPRVPISLVHQQLIRVCPAYKDIPAAALRAFAEAHRDFQVGDGGITPRVPLFPKHELNPEEQTIYRVLSATKSPLGAAEIAAVTRGRQHLTEDRVRQALRISVIVTQDEQGRYTLVRSSPPAATVAQHPSTRTARAPAPSSVVSTRPADSDEIRRDRAEETRALLRAATPRERDDRPKNETQEASNVDAPARATDQHRGTTSETSATVEDLVRRVRDESIVLPEIQRDYVWKRTQVRDLLDSLYRNFPIGAMLMWNTDDLPVAHALGGRDRIAASGGERQYLLDGQQRLTSLSRAMYDGDPDIRFNLETEEFRIANATTRSDRRWIKVSDVFTGSSLAVLRDAGWLEHADADLFSERIDRLRDIRNRRVITNELSGFSYEDVTEIFIRVNSRGTRLRTAELAVAQLAFRLPGMVTDELRGYEEDLAGRGWEIDSRFLLRCLTAVATNQVTYAGLNMVDEAILRDGWRRTRQAMDAFLFLIGDRLGIASVDWLNSTSSFILPVVYLTRTVAGERDEAALLRWFLLANVRSRYSGATETAMAQDLRILTEYVADPFPKLDERIGGMVNGRVAITERDLEETRQGSPLFLLSFLAARAAGALDWWTGERLAATNLPSGELLTIHQIAPKTVFGRDYNQAQVNEIANLVFLARPPAREITRATNLSYLATIPPERLQQQFVPTRVGDWQPTRFPAFLRDRRRLLAIAMNQVLNGRL